MLSLIYNTLQTSQPSYLRRLIKLQPSVSSRSCSSITLFRPAITSYLSFSNRSFQYSAPQLWNTLPSSIRQPSSPNSDTVNASTAHHPPLALSRSCFHTQLKTFLFQRSHPPTPTAINSRKPIPKSHPPKRLKSSLKYHPP